MVCTPYKALPKVIRRYFPKSLIGKYQRNFQSEELTIELIFTDNHFPDITGSHTFSRHILLPPRLTVRHYTPGVLNICKREDY